MKPDKDLIDSKSIQDVVRVIRNQCNIGRAEIARQSGLSIPTVMKISSELLKVGLIKEVGKGESSGGKPPMLLEFIPDAFYSIGVDIGTNNLTCVVTDCAASIAHKTVLPTRRDHLEEMATRIGDCIQAALDLVGIDRDKILGIGLGMPGLIDSATGRVLFSPNFNLVDIDIAGPIRNRFDLPVSIENMSRAMAFGEKHFGLCRDVDDFLCVNLGYGIGSAMIVNGQLYRGRSGTAGELGHITVQPHGELCECGRRGCLEAVASAGAIARNTKRVLASGRKSAILDLAGGNVGAVETKMVFRAARDGDALALEIVDAALDHLAIGLASMTTMLDPDVIVLEGKMSRMGRPFIEQLTTLIDKYKMAHCGRSTKVVVSDFGDDAAAIGAASIVLNTFYRHDGDTLAAVR